MIFVKFSPNLGDVFWGGWAMLTKEKRVIRHYQGADSREKGEEFVSRQN